MRYPKELLFDIETTNLRADFGSMITFGYKWKGEGKKAQAIGIQDMPSFSKRPWDDSQLIREAHKIISEADSLIFHFGQYFDLPFFKTRLLDIGLYFPKVHIQDTWRASKTHLLLQSNRMDNIAEFLGTTRKTKVPKETWRKAGWGHVPSLNEIKKYCINDVETLDEVHTMLLPYMKALNKNIFFEDGEGCPYCGTKLFTKHKERATEIGYKIQYKCLNKKCGHYFTDSKTYKRTKYRPE